MHPRFLSASLSLGLIVAVGAAADARYAAAADASQAVVTVQSHCTSVRSRWLPDERFLDCVAIYRNNASRPVFDIGIDVTVDGSPAACNNCDTGSRKALPPSESGVLQMWIDVSSLESDDPILALTYRASWTGDERELDVPKPELQYIDRVEGSDPIRLIGEVRNVDGRAWEDGGNDHDVWRYPIAAFFNRGKLVGAVDTSREPDRRIAADGRYIFEFSAGKWYGSKLDFDSVRVFFLDEFVRDWSTRMATHWRLTGLEHTVVPDGSGRKRLEYRVSMRSPDEWPGVGRVFAIARRADFHAIGVGDDCVLRLAPGEEASCSGTIELDLRPGVTVDEVRFVTVESGGAISFRTTPTPTPSATPCPEWRTPPPMATLASVAERLWLPWSLRMQADRLCR